MLVFPNYVVHAEFDNGNITGFLKYIYPDGSILRGFFNGGKYIGIVNFKRLAYSLPIYEFYEDGIVIKTFSENEITLILQGKLDAT
jgi:hypothetical protein